MRHKTQLLSALAMTLACIGLAPVFAQQVGTPSGTGPYPAIAESRAELPRHTVYRPVQLPAAALPLYVWGNGGCSSNGLAHAAYLRQIASQGYVIVSLGVAGGGPPAPTDGSTDATQASQMIEAIEWAERETPRDVGALQSPNHVTRDADAGHSASTPQVLAVSHAPRIDTTLVLNSGIYTVPGSGRSSIQV